MTPDTIALLQRLQDQRDLLDEIAHADDCPCSRDRVQHAADCANCECGVRRLAEALDGAVDRLSQERTCFTCRHGKVMPLNSYDPIVCVAEWPGRPGRSAPTFDRRVTADYSCKFWLEKADPETTKGA